MTNKRNTVLYTGVTNDIGRRLVEHQTGKGGMFTKKYHVRKLIYLELFEDIQFAIAREKQIKAGSRAQDKYYLFDEPKIEGSE